MNVKFKNKKIVKEWLTRGKKEFELAEFLLKNNRPLEFVGLFIQQSVEKYIKGFLISNGWELEKIHDLRKLLEEAIKLSIEFQKFVKPFRKITRYYTESRYPLGYDLEYTKEEIKQSLEQAREFISLVSEKL